MGESGLPLNELQIRKPIKLRDVDCVLDPQVWPGQESYPRRRSCASPPHNLAHPASLTSDPGTMSPQVQSCQLLDAETSQPSGDKQTDHDSVQNVHGRETRKKTSEHRGFPSGM